MSLLQIYKSLTILTVVTLLASACGSAQLNESAMSTAVAQTVQAQSTAETAPSVAPTLTPSPLASILPTFTGGPSTGVAAESCTASASLVGETFPDGTIVQPGTTFTKVWQVQNSGTCTWDSSWQL